MEKEIYTVVIETPVGTSTYEFDTLDDALRKIRAEKKLYPEDCKMYIIDCYGNILNINLKF